MAAPPAPPAPPPLAVAAEAGEAHRAFEEAAVTLEDIQRFTVEEGLTDVERAQLYLSGGQAVQELAVIQNLPGLVQATGRGAWTALSRGLAEVARRLDEDGQIETAAAFGTLARERLLPAVDITDMILPMALAGATEGGGSHSAVQAAWLACLGDLCAVVEPSTLHSRVLPAVVSRASVGGRALRERCLGCELLGLVAPHLAAEDLQRTLLRLASSLSMDTEWQVRHAACQQLPALAAAAAAKLEQAALTGVLQDVFSLLEDEEALVRATAWRTLTAVLDLLPLEMRRGQVLLLLLAQCRELDHHAEVQRSLASGFGALMGKLVPDMDGDAEVNACLGCYRSLAWRHDHATRLACASNLAAVLRAGTARRYGSHLHDTLLRLASDADAEVRLAVAGCLPEVASVLGRDRCCQYLRQPVAALLQDERQEVQAALLGRLPQVLEHFTAPLPSSIAAVVHGGARVQGPGGVAATAVAQAAAAVAEEQRGKTFAPFIEPLLRLEAVSGYSWRLHLALLQAMAAFPAFFTGEQLHDRFLPLALKYMAEGAAAVRAAAAAATAAIWRALRRPAHRTALYSRIIHEFGQSKCFRLRMVFIDFCRHAQQHFSSKFLKVHLLEPALSLAYDPVANVRLHLAAAMPALKQVVALPDDVHLLERLNSGMSHLITDGDSDVCQAARKANEEFKRLPVRMSCGALESSPAEVKAFEAADAARSEAERDFTFDPDGLERIRADIASYDDQLRPTNTRLALSLPPARADSSSSGSSSRGGSSRSMRPAASAAVAAGGKARLPAVAAAAAAGAASHPRSAPDSPELRREKAAAAASAHGRSASSGGALGTSSSSSSKVLGTPASRAAVRLKGTATSAAQQAGSSGNGAAGAEAASDVSQHASSGSSRLGRPGLSAAASKAGAPAASAPKLTRPSPTAAGTKRASVGQSPAQTGHGGSLSDVPKSPPQQQQQQQQQQSQHASLPERLAAAAAASDAGGRLHGSSHSPASRALVSRTAVGGSSRAAGMAGADMMHLSAKLKAGLHLHASAPGPELPASSSQHRGSALPGKAGAGSSGAGRRLSADGRSVGSSSSSSSSSLSAVSRGLRPPGRSSMQHGSK